MDENWDSLTFAREGGTGHPRFQESLATEIALWVVGTARPEDVERFRATRLIPALRGTHPFSVQAAQPGCCRAR
jgi:hypothetical protein